MILKTNNGSFAAVASSHQQMTGDSSLLAAEVSLQWSAAQSLLADEISIDLQIFCSLADPRPHNCLSSHTTYIIQYTSYVHIIYMSGVWSGVLYVMLHNGTWRLSGLSMSNTMRIYNINSCKKSSAKKSWFCSAFCFLSQSRIKPSVSLPVSMYPCTKWCLLN